MSYRKRLRTVGGAVVTTLAILLVYLALTVPEQIFRLPPGNSVASAMIRVPLEAIVAIALILALPARPRRIVVLTLGVLLGLLTVIKIVDMAFFAVLAREFDPINDWILFRDGYGYLRDTEGGFGAFAIAAGAILLAVALVVFLTLAVRRIARLAVAYARPTRHTVLAFASAWLIMAMLGLQFVAGLPVASTAAADLARDTVLAVPQDIADRKAFDREVRADAFRDVAPDKMLTALRGKDVILGFVESYGRDAVENPEFNGPVLEQLRADQEKLAAKGFAAKSGYLTSTTSGGGSWLAHSTFLAGLRIDSQQRYRSVVSGDRLTLTRAFKNSGFRTVGMEPGVTFAWPEGDFYGYDTVWDSRNMGYNGPKLSWSPMPDQFVMKRFHDLEYAKEGRGPLLAEITLTSSHTPWFPLPSMLPWDQIGDGSVYGPMIDALGEKPPLKQAYAKSVAYSIDSFTSYLAEYGDDNLVMVLLGDHQPNSLVVGQNASKDVPITILAKDPKVLDRIATWGWTDGLTPAPDAPVWPMQDFRDRFLTAYSPEGDPH